MSKYTMVGAGDGPMLGREEGFADGIPEGGAVGLLVGTSEGTPEGTLEGADVGIEVPLFLAFRTTTMGTTNAMTENENTIKMRTTRSQSRERSLPMVQSRGVFSSRAGRPDLQYERLIRISSPISRGQSTVIRWMLMCIRSIIFFISEKLRLEIAKSLTTTGLRKLWTSNKAKK